MTMMIYASPLSQIATTVLLLWNVTAEASGQSPDFFAARISIMKIL